MTDYLDTSTVSLALTPSAIDVGPSVDNATIPLKLTISALNVGPSTDSATILLVFTVTTVEQRISTDATTIPFKFTISSSDRFGPLLIAFSSITLQKWDSTKESLRWSIATQTEITKKWKVHFAGKVSDVPTG